MKNTLRISSFASLGLFAMLAACSSSSSSGSSTGTDAGNGGDSSTTADTGTTGDDSGTQVDSSTGGDTGTTADGGALPTITINIPAGDSSIPTLAATVDSMNQKVVSIPFVTTNFMLAAPGACTNNTTDNNCGHIHITVDGNNCTPDGAPYNNADATGSPAIAIMSQCPMVDGSHSVLLELHHGDHSPVLSPTTMAVISASASIIVTGP